MNLPGKKLRERIDLYERLMRLDKPIGILLLLWPTLWALWLSARGRPNWLVVWIFVLGTVLMRSAGCVINDLADRNFDPHVARTRERPLAAGRVSANEAILLFLALVAAAFALVLPLFSWLLAGLCVAALFLAASYPFSKRFLAVPQAYLGVAFGFGIPMAYAVELGRVPLEAWWLLLANVFWAIAYDTEYALVDRADDLKIGIRSSAITFGRADVAAVMLCYALALGLIAALGYRLGLGELFYCVADDRGGDCRLSLHADPRTRSAALLHGFPAQQLAGCQRLRRYCPRFSGQQVESTDEKLPVLRASATDGHLAGGRRHSPAGTDAGAGRSQSACRDACQPACPERNSRPGSGRQTEGGRRTCRKGTRPLGNGQTSRPAFRRASWAAHATGDAPHRHRWASGGQRLCPHRCQRRSRENHRCTAVADLGLCRLPLLLSPQIAPRTMKYHDLRDFIAQLEGLGELKRIGCGGRHAPGDDRDLRSRAACRRPGTTLRESPRA
jgi:4-hydroxybenzoate polyprenyltransferase